MNTGACFHTGLIFHFFARLTFFVVDFMRIQHDEVLPQVVGAHYHDAVDVGAIDDKGEVCEVGDAYRIIR